MPTKSSATTNGTLKVVEENHASNETVEVGQSESTETITVQISPVEKQPETPKTIHTELARIQRELIAPKNQFNSFGKYKYRSCEDILEGLKKVQGECSITLDDEMINVGNRFYVQATATLRFNGDTISVKALARESEDKKGMDSSQVTGATSSYARKYALNGLFAIDDTKDADTRNNSDSDDKIAIVVKKIGECKSVQELQTLWNNLSTDSRNDKSVIEAKDRRKDVLLAK